MVEDGRCDSDEVPEEDGEHVRPHDQSAQVHLQYDIHLTTTFQPSRFEFGDMYTHCRNIAEYVFDGVSVCCGHSDGRRPLVMYLVYVLVQERVVKQSEAKRN